MKKNICLFSLIFICGCSFGQCEDSSIFKENIRLLMLNNHTAFTFEYSEIDTIENILSFNLKFYFSIAAADKIIALFAPGADLFKKNSYLEMSWKDVSFNCLEGSWISDTITELYINGILIKNISGIAKFKYDLVSERSKIAWYFQKNQKKLFFYYQNNCLQTISSDENYNELISNLKKKKRSLKLNDNQLYVFLLSTPVKQNRFLENWY